MDRGIATKKNSDWMKVNSYRYLVVSRERNRQFDESQSVETVTAQERIGRLKEKSRGIAQHYEIELTKDDSGKVVTAIKWHKVPKAGTSVTNSG